MKGMMTAVTCQVLGRFLWSDIFFFCLHHQLLQHNVKTDLNPHKQNHIIHSKYKHLACKYSAS